MITSAHLCCKVLFPSDSPAGADQALCVGAEAVPKDGSGEAGPHRESLKFGISNYSYGEQRTLWQIGEIGGRSGEISVVGAGHKRLTFVSDNAPSVWAHLKVPSELNWLGPTCERCALTVWAPGGYPYGSCCTLADPSRLTASPAPPAFKLLVTRNCYEISSG